MILKRIRQLALATVAVIVPVFGAPALAQNAELDAYANSSYGFCDAKKLSVVWNIGIGEAKAVIGAKILGNIQHLADEDIASTNGTVSCDWDDTELAFEDAMKLAAYWGKDSIEAKQKAAQMHSELGNKKFIEAMGHVIGRSVASAPGQPTSVATSDYDAFANSSYGYCDAKKLAAYWKTDIDDAKVSIGNKIRNNIEHILTEDIAATKNTVACDWGDTQLSFSDAEKLAAYWGRDTTEAKQKAVEMFSELGTKGFFEVMGDVVSQT